MPHSLLLVVLCLVANSIAENYSRRQSRSTEDPFQGDNVTSNEPCPTKNKTLHLVAMAPFPDPIPELAPGWEGGPAVIPASQLAVRHINSRCDILEEYMLELLIEDSGCDVIPKTVASFVNSTLQNSKGLDHRVAGIIGPGCSAAALEVGFLLAQRDIDLLHITPSATSPNLANITAYPNTFRPISSSSAYVKLYMGLIEKLGFSNVSIFYESDREIHTTVASVFERMLHQLMHKKGVMNVTVQSFGISRFYIPLNEIRDKLRIVFVFGGIGISNTLMCLAYHRNMRYPDYQFFFSDRLRQHFLANVSFTFEGETFECSEDVMEEAIEGNVLSQFELIRTHIETTLINNMNYTQFDESYREQLKEYKEELNLTSVVDTFHHSGYYDSVWAFALALNTSIPHLDAKLNATLGDYWYGNSAMTNIIRSELLKVNFEGIRGTVKFNSSTQGGEDVTVMNMFWVQKENPNSVKLVATYDPIHEERFNFTILDYRNVFIENLFSPDPVRPPDYVVYIVFLLVGVITIITGFFQVINVKWMKAKLIKATSPTLNHLIFLGCYLYILSILFVSVKEMFGNKHPVLYTINCSGFIWCESLALTLIYGTISVKTWRLLRIFSHASAKMMNNLQTYRLALYVAALLLLDVVFNVTWNIVNIWSLRKAAQNVRRIRAVCHCENIYVWIALLLGIKALLAAVVLYLSIITRRIPKQEYKQTKATNSLVYIFLFIYSFLLPTYVLFRESTNIGLVTLSYFAICLKNLLCVTSCIVFIFLPPLLTMLKGEVKSKNYHSLRHFHSFYF